MTHLWEIDHPYQMAEGSYGVVGQVFSFDSWSAFVADLPGVDEDYDLLIRWDWMDPAAEDAWVDEHTLLLFFAGQRKSSRWSAQVVVTTQDEEAVRAFLAARFAYLVSLWAPFGALSTADPN